ncbi:NAD-P-binding protein [Mycena kentingensis (nom. inval.)]|nr:NAD-P-binding protein [Mycena kentingensis (nom. inval.)]
MRNILLTGATGYIGGSVLQRLWDQPTHNAFTVLVRSQEKAATLNRLFGRKHNLNAVVGSNSNLGLLRELAAAADVVIACTDADDLPATQAILEGLRDRFGMTRVAPTLIHTSGTGVLSDDARGMFASSTIYSDLNINQLESLPPTQPHRDVDLAIVDADLAGYVKSYIVLPSTIYGLASGPLVDSGIQNARSQQIPRLVEVALQRGQGGMVGAGRNHWNNVHIDDVADLFALIFDLSTKATSSPGTLAAHGRAGFYFAENGEHTLYKVGEAIARVLSSMGKGSATPTTFTSKEMSAYFPSGTSLGTNSRCRAERGRKIGWKPANRTADMLRSVCREVELSM